MSRNIVYLALSIVLISSLSHSSTESSRFGSGDPTGSILSPNLGPEQDSPQWNPIPFANCDISRDNCGSVDLGSESYWIADGAHDTLDATIFFVNVGNDYVFQFDPVTCTAVEGTYYSVSWYPANLNRGIGYDPEYHQIWVGGWGDTYMFQNSAVPPYELISTNYTGLPIASIAVDDESNFLFIGTNSYQDRLYVYDITGGTLGSQLGSWQVPWQTETDGYDMAGMGFDDESDQLVMVNQYAGYSGTVRELFDFSLSDGPAPVGYCDLSYTEYGWGVGVKEDGDSIPTSFSSYVTDIGDGIPPVDIDEYGLPAVFPPYDLVCEGTEEDDVYLTWVNGEVYDSVMVYRDGGLIATLPGSAISYLDVAPDVGYHTYGVSGLVGPDESGQVPCSVTIYPGPEQVCFDFNATDGNWTAGGYADFEWGYPSYVIDGNAWETNIGSNYYNDACGWLDSQSINLGPEGGWLRFDSYNHIEMFDDGWNVQISTDNGASWSMIYPINGYDVGAPVDACDEGLGGDTNSGYRELEVWNFDLTDYPNTSVMIRFMFMSDTWSSYAGLVLDNICIFGGSVPSVSVRCQLLNPDTDGDGVRDVHVGDYLYYSTTFINQTSDSVEYGAGHFIYARQSCPNPEDPVVSFGPDCKGTITANGIATHYYRVSVPNNANLLGFNPFAVEVAGWECAEGVPATETDRCCFDVVLLPAWEPPAVPTVGECFIVYEISEPPYFPEGEK